MGRSASYSDIERLGPMAIKPWERFTEKEKEFVEAYCSNGMNAADAYYAAYSNKVRRHGAYKRALAILKRPHIEREVKKRLKLFEMSEEELKARHSRVARGDIGEMFEEHDVSCPECGHVIYEEGDVRLSMKRAKEMGLTHLIKEYTVYPNGRVNVKLYDSDQARRDLMKVEGMFSRKTEEAINGLAGVLAAAMQQSEEDVEEIEVDVKVLPPDAD